MLIKYFMIGALFVSPLCVASDAIELLYMNYKLKVPSGPILILDPGTEDHVFILKYEGPIQKETISIFKDNDAAMVKQITEAKGCSFDVFLDDTFNSNDQSPCDPLQIETFKKVNMKETNDYGKWSGTGSNSNISVYYIMKSGLSMAFMIDGADIFLFQSSFLKKEQLKYVFSNYVQ